MAPSNSVGSLRAAADFAALVASAQGSSGHSRAWAAADAGCGLPPAWQPATAGPGSSAAAAPQPQPQPQLRLAGRRPLAAAPLVATHWPRSTGGPAAAAADAAVAAGRLRARTGTGCDHFCSTGPAAATAARNPLALLLMAAAGHRTPHSSSSSSTTSSSSSGSSSGSSRSAAMSPANWAGRGPAAGPSGAAAASAGWGCGWPRRHYAAAASSAADAHPDEARGQPGGEGTAAAGGGASNGAPAEPTADAAAEGRVAEMAAAAEAVSGPAVPGLGFVSGKYEVSQFPPERIRNFSIIAHVDHGKSTLADRLMEATGALGGRATHSAQYLDKLQVERERGITVKAQTVSLVYRHPPGPGGQPYLLNLIDTPGHVDFSYEVSRSLAACQGALLVVDASQGIQAQTVANFYLAFEQGLDLVPVVNKIDLPAADPRGCTAQLAAAFDMDPAAVLLTSAKTGLGMEAVLPAVIQRIRPPGGDPAGPLRLLLFDAFHDQHRGVVVLVEVVDGAVAVGDRVAMASTGAVYEVQECGLQAPERQPTGRLLTGQVGYMMCGIKDLKAARVGDTMYAPRPGAPPPPSLPGFKPAKAMVFAGLFPLGGEGQEFDGLAAAMDKLLLNDASVVVRRENSDALGPGFRCGFLGMLHMEIFTQRLEQEFGAAVVTTTPMVPYTLQMPDGTEMTLESAADFPLDKKISAILEPTVTATLITPDVSVGRLMELCAARRGEPLEHSSLGGGRTMLRYRLPLAELAGDFYSAVKSRSQGYASFDYEEGPYRPADLVRLDVLAHGRPVDALARMVARDEAAGLGRALLAKMREMLDRQQFEVVLQAAANGKVVARETLKALRKNVTAKCYGGDVTRKRKLLDKQKEGKRRMKRMGSIDVPQELFPELMKTR
ncbi:hypothetical protein HXX76_002832 [Chlamydomonas incerta]|uniref:Translation factor GUF1 homolog, mitochondrial n=1 Tax=Chlamydomonas incerta TaxID=51695 RepID=A0A835W9W1_CHLIN|nr:hypothetical protein HXX76_002832 [Chlamydomonas incerta]|eukprot:KAG2442751.1 hypothetical protein HXX76_002832 [Chlamydomonas incerta]